MDTLDKAKEEAERLADQMKKSAEQIHQEVKERLNNPDPYNRVIHQLRTGHMVALGVEVFTLYLAWRQVSFFFILLPILLASGALWIVGQRWYQQADGRADFNKLLSADNPAVKARHGLFLLGGFVLSLLSQWTAPSLASTVTGLIFSLSSHAAVLVGAVCTAIEVYEGVKLKNR